MADITVKMRGALDGAYARGLVDELGEIGSVTITQLEEQRSWQYMPELPEVTREIVIVLATAIALGRRDAAIRAVRKWAKGKRAANEKQERVAVLYGPDGEVLLRVPEES